MAQIYLKFEGAGATPDIEGIVKRKNYEKTIAVDSFGFGAHHEGGRPTVDYKSKSLPGNASPSSVNISKVAGPESPGLLTACLKGTVIDKAIITMDGSSEDAVATPIYKYELELVVVKAISQGGGSGGGEASIGEQLDLDYDKITFTHVPTSKIASYSQSTTSGK